MPNYKEAIRIGWSFSFAGTVYNESMNPQNYTVMLPKPFRIIKRVAKILSLVFLCIGLLFAVPSGLFFPVLLFMYLFTPVGWIAAMTILIWAGIKGYESYINNPQGFFRVSLSPVRSVVLVVAIVLLLFTFFVLRPF